MSKLMNVGYNFQDLTVQLGDGVNAEDAVNKGQLDGIETSLQTYADQAEVDAKAYTDAKILGLGERVGGLDPATGLPTTGSGDGGAIDKNDYWIFTAGGTLIGQDVQKYERLVALTSNPDTTDNSITNTDWVVEHSPDVADQRKEITSLAVAGGATEIVNHALGYKYVSVAVYNDATDDQTDIHVHLVDANNLEITNESANAITVSGVIHI